MYLIDSCTIVSCFRRSEPGHAESRKLLESLPCFYITEHILAEVATILKFKEDFEHAKEAFSLLLENENIHILKLTSCELDDTVQLFLKHKRISFVDASLIVLAKSRGLALISQDNALSKAFKHGGKSLLSMR